MCDCQSNFLPYRQIKTYSNVTGAQLRQQCADENNLDINDPMNKSLIDACVQKKRDEKAGKIVGYIQTAGNVFNSAASLIGQLFGQQQPVVDYGEYPDPNQNNGKKPTNVWLIVGGVVVFALLGFFAYKAFKNKGGNK